MKIRSDSKSIMAIDDDRVLKYADRILDEDCVVTLEFSPISKELALIKIIWADKGIAEDMKKILVEKYGEYKKSNIFIEEYRWQSAGEFDVIVLEYDYAGTTLTYYGGDSYRKYRDEFDKFYESEKDIF
ncbi:MAG: hypothetical protein PHZ27_02870 [Candidatus Omnitrophica bacterium]|nr:hypothetical protein [Candidatus Omnitrophota bacterium]MDD5441134.1 hypothetical protein [Candidatus Omnitrophota bacterium]